MLVAPDLVRDEFTDDTVLRWSSKKENIAVEIEEHISDPNPFRDSCRVPLHLYHQRGRDRAGRAR